jgi:hypothetical protein
MIAVVAGREKCGVMTGTLPNEEFNTERENSSEEVSVSPLVLDGVTAKTKMPSTLTCLISFLNMGQRSQQ